MRQVSRTRLGLFVGGLALIGASVLVQASYPTDLALGVPGDGVTSLIAIAGAFTVGLALARRRRK